MFPLKEFTVNLTKKKVVKYVDRRTVDYNVYNDNHKNAVLPGIPQDVLDLQAADDKYIKCFRCKTKILCDDVWHIVKCPKCDRLNRVPKDLLASNKVSEYYGDPQRAIYTNNSVFVIIICPFCRTHNQVRKVAMGMECYKCHNQINLEKYHTNGERPIKVNQDGIPLAKALGPLKSENKLDPFKSDYYKEDIRYFVEKERDEKQRIKQIEMRRMKIQDETNRFLTLMNESSKRYLKTDNNKTKDNLNRMYAEYVEKVYKTPLRENQKAYWLVNDPK